MQARTRDLSAVRRRYAARAASYDRSPSLRVSRGAQRRAVAALALRPGERVLDVACGTGVNFADVEAAIGAHGALVGIDLSDAMLARARERIARHGWRNVELVATAVEEARPPGPFDAALLSFAHDVLRSQAAVDNVLAQLCPGARVAATGIAYPPRPRVARPLVRAIAGRYFTSTAGLERPWDLLERRLGRMREERLVGGLFYVVTAP